MKHGTLTMLIFVMCVLFIGCDAMALMIKSSAFNDGDTMPAKYTCKGENISPSLFWEQPPGDTGSFAIICEDPDAPGGMWVHWVIYNIPEGVTELPEHVPIRELTDNGAKQGMNDFGRIGYGGPCPPPGTEHKYFFRLYALDQILEVNTGLTRDQLLKAMKDHIIEEAEIMVKFKR